MKRNYLCYWISAMTLCCSLLSAGLGVAATYQNQWCMMTPAQPCMTGCGCPVADTPEDFCVNSKPDPMLGGMVRFYYCMGMPTSSCTTPTMSCGGEVWLCACWKCNNCSVFCPPTSSCIKTDKTDVCGGSYGCQTN